MIHDCIDLHTHSSASDGSDSPRDVVRKAAAAGLNVIALTDHDTLDGLDEAEDEAQKQGIVFVRGCEISAATPWGEAHFLGLWIPRDSAAVKRLEKALGAIRQKRLERNLAIADRLRALGFGVSYEQAAELAGGRIVGRPHFAELLCLLGAVKDRKEAFRTYLGRDGLAFVPRRLPTPQEAITMLKEAGALVSMAHPRLLRASVTELDALLTEIVPSGLDALEAYHSEHDAGDVRECVELADRFGLQLTGGSDYHGHPKPNIALGRGKGGLRVRLHVYNALKAYRDRCGLGV
ncbi:PHP domain-containing protein [Mailhella sp.]|uniref:PHP domain-containing protein n=1 Tax=Mailhella sp. TaxID=1981029 RepID=UPI0040635D46